MARGILDPVTLPAWPTKSQNIHWSPDDLAVACGELVHVLTPKTVNSALRDSTGTARWHINTLRVNLFNDRSEWPYLKMATKKHFSIGEEQGNSSVSTLEWSSEGLSMHKRCVLAILTTNLVLGLWETDGNLGSYKRTLIANHFLSGGKDGETGAGRRKIRIRAFCWSPVLKTQASNKEIIHHLVVADDDGSIIIFRVSKLSEGKFGQWLFKKVFECSVAVPTGLAPDESSFSPLQRKISQEAPMSRIEQEPWQQDLPATQSNCEQSFSSIIKITRGYLVQEISIYAKVTCTVMNDTQPGNLAEDIVSSVVLSIDTENLLTKPRTLRNQSTEAPEVLLPPEHEFKSALRSVCSEFDHHHKLGGRYRARFWGQTRSFDNATLAACITLHPSDMIEHSIPSSEKSIIIFETVNTADTYMNEVELDEEEVRSRITKFVSSQATLDLGVRSALDEHILRLHSALAKSPTQAWRLKTAKPTAQALPMTNPLDANKTSFVTPISVPAEGEDVDRRAALSAITSSDPAVSERCEICSADVPFRGDTMSATCLSGHQFTRCNLSFITIQEPGISKYCSGCGKQFLDLSKLGASEGSSVSRALFAAFDVCPYCQAKFRS